MTSYHPAVPWHSFGGGAGSSVGPLWISQLRDEYHDRMTVTFSSTRSQVVSEVEPHNALLCFQHAVGTAGHDRLFGNEAFYDTYAIAP